MSLRLRLGLGYGALTSLAVAVVCAYGYAVHSRTHYDELDAVLVSTADHVAEEFAAAPTRQEQSRVLEASRALGTETWVVGTDGAVLQQAPTRGALPQIVPTGLLGTRQPPPYPWLGNFAPALHGMAPAGVSTLAVIRDGSRARFRIYLLPLGDGLRYVVASRPLHHIDTAVAGFGRFMALMAILGSMATSLVGWLLARQALRPLAALAGTARTIARSRAFTNRIAFGSSRDELGRLAATFNEMLGSLDSAYQAQQRFIAAASHELRAPLTVVQANLELLRRPNGQLSDLERRCAIEESYAEAERMARLVADLLVLARADAGVPIRLERVELDRVLLQVMSGARHLARGHRMMVDAIEPIIVNGDSDRLNQLLLILVDNAIQYTPDGGSIVVRLSRVDDVALVVVRDSGIGISTDDLPHVFERFYRADQPRTRESGGTGLGLSIAQWIVNEHGGSLAVSSTLGQGTTVHVRIPAVAGAPRSGQ